MTHEFKPEQVFILAERMEDNAAKFYERAAGIVKDEKAKKLLQSLAEWEKRHLEYFSKMKTDISDLGPMDYRGYIEKLFEPTDAELKTIHAMADNHFALEDVPPEDRLTEETSLRKILKMALNLEKDAVIFYTSLQLSMKASRENDAINKIIREEMSHISSLNSQLARCKAENIE